MGHYHYDKRKEKSKNNKILSDAWEILPKKKFRYLIGVSLMILKTCKWMDKDPKERNNNINIPLATKEREAGILSIPLVTSNSPVNR